MDSNATVKSKPKIEKYDLCKKDYIFAVIFLAVCVLMSFLGICEGFRGGFTITSIMLSVATTVYLKDKAKKVKSFEIWCFILAIMCSLSFAITSSEAVRFFSFVAVIFLSLVWYRALKYETRSENDIIPDVLNDVVGLLDNYGKSMLSLIVGKGNRAKPVGKVIIGIALAVPVLIVVIPLLVLSDEAFGGLVTMFADNFALGVIKFVIGIILASLVIAYSFSIKLGKPVERMKSGFKGIDNVILISFLSVVSVCYAVYLFSQLAYFFSAFSGFLPDNYVFSFSEYARRGFFEMSIIAGINLVIILVATFFGKKEKSKTAERSVQIICTFISVFTLIIIATAISKMVLYIKELGMTELRITTSAFMIFLGIVFVSVILKLYIGKIKVIKTAIVTAGLILALLGIFNVKAVVAGYNYNAYINGQMKAIDAEAMYDLGDEGVPYLVKLALNGDDEAKLWVETHIIDENYHYYGPDYDMSERRYNGIGEFSISRYKAYVALEDYFDKMQGKIDVSQRIVVYDGVRYS